MVFNAKFNNISVIL